MHAKGEGAALRSKAPFFHRLFLLFWIGLHNSLSVTLIIVRKGLQFLFNGALSNPETPTWSQEGDGIVFKRVSWKTILCTLLAAASVLSVKVSTHECSSHIISSP